MDTINVTKRDLTIKAKKLRKLGVVPGCVFGKSLPETISIQIGKNIARKLMLEKREGSKLVLNIDGQNILTQIKERTVDSLTGEIVQLSFQALKDDEKVNSIIHIFLINHEKFGGLLEKSLMEIPYVSLPGDMIDTITIDLADRKNGDIIKVKDISELMSDKIELQVNQEETVIKINEKKYMTQV